MLTNYRRLAERSAGARLARSARLAALAAVALVAASAAAQRLGPLGPLEGGVVTYFVAEGEPDSRFRSGDEELARWALGDWERAAEGRLKFVPGEEDTALVRVYWARPGGGQYGEMLPIEVKGKRGAAVFVRPDTEALGPEIAQLARDDPLFRDTIVYLTCVHELGHALGLEHTANFADVMYFFGFGGDIPRFFGRYRERLEERVDIAAVSGLSEGDLAQLRALYAPAPGDTRAAVSDAAPR